MSLYVNPRELEAFRTAFKAAGKKLDTGKSCVRFRRLEDLELPAVARLVAATRLEDFVKVFEASRAGKAGRAGRERLRPSRAEDEQIRGEGSASVRAGGGAPAPVKKSRADKAGRITKGKRR